ncbi:hypothetical protein LTS18_002610, partial [Coniosporium uncinatum]
TTVPPSFHGFVESDGHISIEPEHFSSNISGNASAYISVVPGYGRTLAGIALLPFTAPSQPLPSAPKLTYHFYTVSPNVTNANVTVLVGNSLNNDPTRPMKYAISVDDAVPEDIQPINSTKLGTLPGDWLDMVANAVTVNTTMHDLSVQGSHALNLWLLEPGLVIQKLVIDMGGVRPSYLGPPESAASLEEPKADEQILFPASVQHHAIVENMAPASTWSPLHHHPQSHGIMHSCGLLRHEVLETFFDRTAFRLVSTEDDDHKMSLRFGCIQPRSTANVVHVRNYLPPKMYRCFVKHLEIEIASHSVSPEGDEKWRCITSEYPALDELHGEGLTSLVTIAVRVVPGGEEFWGSFAQTAGAEELDALVRRVARYLEGAKVRANAFQFRWPGLPVQYLEQLEGLVTVEYQ